MISDFELERRARRHPFGSDTKTESDHRGPYRHDRDRILYSSAFRRLSGITQVVSPSGSHPTHNRLTHSLEVAQIGRSLAERLLLEHNQEDFEHLGGLDPDVVEAACLAHDLGHPPFGHIAETELNHLVTHHQAMNAGSDLDGFEGNAQSFRIVSKLSIRYRNVEGLNLTRATLSALSKYPWRRDTTGKRSRKWGAYSSEIEDFEWSRFHLNGSLKASQTLEARLMDFADDIAYAVHDMEDFYRIGVIPLDRLVSDEGERDRFIDGFMSRPDREGDAGTWKSIFEELLESFPQDPFSGTRFDRASLRSLTSALVGRYVAALSVDDDGNVEIDKEKNDEVILLKELTGYYVIESRALISQRFGHAKLIRSLFSTLLQAATGREQARDSKVLPDFFREQIEESEFDGYITVRAVADAIASMTEAQAIGLHGRLNGYSLGSALDPILN